MPQLKKEAIQNGLSLRTAIIFASVFVVGILVGRVRIGESIWPFGAAYVFAAFLNYKILNPYLALAGVLTALCTMIPQMEYIGFNFTLVSISAAAMMVMQHFRINTDRRHAMLTAVGAYIACTAAFRSNNLYSVFSSAVELLLCLIILLVMDTVIKLVFEKHRRTVLTDEEIVSVVLAAMLVILGFGNLNILGVYFRSVAAIYLCMMAAYIGGTAIGACCGAVLGLAAMLGGADPLFMSNLAMAGLVGGAVKPLKKPAVIAAFIFTNAILTLYFNGSTHVIIPLADNASAAILFAVTPKKAHDFLGQYTDMNLKRERECEIHSKRFREITTGRLKEIAGVLRNAAEVFRDSTEKNKDEAGISYMIAGIPEEACAKCVFYKVCWDKEFESTFAAMRKLYAKYRQNGTIKAGDLNGDFLHRCTQPESVVEEAKKVFYRYETNYKWQNKVMESRMVVGEQLAGVSKVIESLGQEVEMDMQFRSDMEDRIRMRLDAAGILVKEVCVEMTGGNITVILKTKACGGVGMCEKTIAKIISKECGRRMARCSDICTGKSCCTLRYEQARNFSVYTGIAAIPKEGNRISGDAHSFEGLQDGRYMLLICDGMGSGEEAAKESYAAVTLMEDFYRAGFDDKTIFQTINKLLLLSSSEEMFSTMDLCMLDLTGGFARFTKIGAPHSYIVRGDCVKKIRAGALPLGILDDFKPAVFDTDIQNGDMLIMFTDGIADLELKDEEFTRIILGAAEGTVQEAADNILMAALAHSNGIASDDITVMVSKIRENRIA